MRPAFLLAVLLVLPLASAAAQQDAPPTPSPAPAVSPAEQVVEAQLDAYNRHDVEAFLSTYAPDVKIYDHPDRLRMAGLEQMRKRYGDLFAKSPRVHATVSQRMVQGDFVLDHEHVTGLSDGAEIRAVVIYEVKNGRIQNVWFVR